MPVVIAGRDILENGSVVMDIGENTATITVSGLKFELNWKQGAGEQRVEAEDISPGSVRINLINAENSMGSTYAVQDVGSVGGRQLGFSLYWQSVHGAKGTSRFFAYTFTAR